MTLDIQSVMTGISMPRSLYVRLLLSGSISFHNSTVELLSE